MNWPLAWSIGLHRQPGHAISATAARRATRLRRPADLAVLLPARLAMGKPFSLLCLSLDHFASLRLRHGAAWPSVCCRNWASACWHMRGMIRWLTWARTEFAILSEHIDDSASHAALARCCSGWALN